MSNHNKTFLDSELIIRPDGAIYHLGLIPSQVFRKVILVGDQNRVDLVAEFFDEVFFESQTREFKAKGGSFDGKEILVLSTGIDPDNIDIVLNELDALVNISFANKKANSDLKSLDIVRIGTCGILVEDIEVGSYILSEMALGLDNLAHYYDIKETPLESEISKTFVQSFSVPKSVTPYVSLANVDLVNRFKEEQIYNGITITAPGFTALKAGL